MKALQKLQNCRVGYESLTEVTELSGKGMKIIQNLQNCRVGYGNHTEVTELSGRVWKSYKIYRTVG